MKKMLRLFFAMFMFSLLTVFAVQMSSCDEDTLDDLAGCSGCPDSSPWSKPGSSNCYATQAECEASEGSGCILCN